MLHLNGEIHQAKLGLQTFSTASETWRRDISCQFQRVREVVNTNERDALAQFDSIVCATTKRLKMQVEALEVKSQQLLACIECQAQHPPVLDKAEQAQNVCTLGSLKLGLGVMVDMLEQMPSCWFFNSVSAPSDFRHGNEVLKEMQRVIDSAKNKWEATIGTLRNSSFQGRCVMETEEMNFGKGIGGMAMSPDGSMLAYSDIDRNNVTLTSTCGRVIGELHGHFVSPNRLCFSHDGNSVLVANGHTRHQIQQVSLRNKHMRCIGKDRFLDRTVFGVDANRDVIVATTLRGSCVFVFNYGDGNVVRIIGEHNVTNCIAVKLSPDGTSIAVTEDGLMRVSVFTLEGLLDKRFETPVEFCPNDLCFLDNGELVVSSRNCRLEYSVVTLFDSDGVSSRCVVPELACENWFKVCSHDGMLFVALDKTIQIFT